MMTNYQTLNDFCPRGKRILVRVDLNVPMQGDIVTDKSRINKIIPTIIQLSKAGGKVIILSHFGRPNGKYVKEMSLQALMPSLKDSLKEFNVYFSSDCKGEIARSNILSMKEGDILLLENLRFYKGEEIDSLFFAKELAGIGDIYVNDAFSVSHRAHASISTLPKILPSYAGPLLHSELEALTKALEKPSRPLGAVVGGAKVSTKLEILTNLVKKVDYLIIGGGMANTFLFARGLSIGKSLAERDLVETAKNIELAAKETGCEIILQTDAIVAEELRIGVETKTLPIKEIPENYMILDAGPISAQNFSRYVSKCKTIVWNGPLGAFEIPPFDDSTVSVSRYVAELTKQKKLISIAGGGDTVAALAHAGSEADFSYISTAGGAFLEWLEGKKLPGILALQN
jgi:phosphoglycerate kinase